MANIRAAWNSPAQICGPAQAVEDDRKMKYLGVWFEATPGWWRQRSVLQKQMQAFKGKLMTASMTMEQAIYCVNTAAVPAMTYPLQVTNVPRGTLRKWDA